MVDYTIKRLEEVDDVLGDYPGEMRMMTGALGAEQVAFTYRRMPQHTGGKGSYGHRHKTQEEVYFVMSGKLQFKLGDEVLDLERGSVVRVHDSIAGFEGQGDSCSGAGPAASGPTGTPPGGFEAFRL